MTKTLFGFLPDGRGVHEYTLKSDKMTVCILDMGGIVRRLLVGNQDIVGGYDTLAEYLEDDSYQGALIGRVGNRIGNATFTMDGKTFRLAKNDNGRHHLHGGAEGFNRKIWTVDRANDASLALSYVSLDGEEGYPGTLTVRVVYRVVEDALVISYTAECDKNTPINLTNHTYFNLNGYGGENVLGHTVTIHADTVTEVDDDLIPNGNHPSVENTPFDFRTPHTVGERLSEAFPGYDHNFIFAGAPTEKVADLTLPHVATVKSALRTMDVFTDQPCMQFYTGNFLGGKPDFKGGVERRARHAFCMETQTEPDSVNHGGGILPAGEIYHHTTVYRIRNY